MKKREKITIFFQNSRNLRPHNHYFLVSTNKVCLAIFVYDYAVVVDLNFFGEVIFLTVVKNSDQIVRFNISLISLFPSSSNVGVR